MKKQNHGTFMLFTDTSMELARKEKETKQVREKLKCVVTKTFGRKEMNQFLDQEMLF